MTSIFVYRFYDDCYTTHLLGLSGFGEWPLSAFHFIWLVCYAKNTGMLHKFAGIFNLATIQ